MHAFVQQKCILLYGVNHHFLTRGLLDFYSGMAYLLENKCMICTREKHTSLQEKSNLFSQRKFYISNKNSVFFAVENMLLYKTKKNTSLQGKNTISYKEISLNFYR